MKRLLSAMFLVAFLFGIAGSFYGILNSDSSPLIPNPSIPAAAPIITVPVLDTSLGLVGLSYLPNVNGSPQFFPNFGPFFRLSRNFIGYQQSDGSWKSYVDIGCILFADGTSNPAISQDTIYNLGAGIGLGFLDDAVTVSFAFIWLFNGSVNIPAYSIIITSTAYKF